MRVSEIGSVRVGAVSFVGLALCLGGCGAPAPEGDRVAVERQPLYQFPPAAHSRPGAFGSRFFRPPAAPARERSTSPRAMV
jgi:hypothetical protein